MSKQPAKTRQPHVALDLASRDRKALKIERLLDLKNGQGRLRLLDVGTGSGGIAHYFARHPTLECDVTSVDVCDNRLLRDGYAFHLVEGVRLPFDDASFDVVLSNHVIEHVGERAAQLAHLRELRRVMAPNAVGYLAVPNRWMLIEPHYRLAFLSWLPRPLRTPYLRLMRRGEHYDCEPLSLPRVDALLAEAGVVWRHLEVEGLRAALDIEDEHGPGARLAGWLPNAVLGLLRRAIPTLVCRIELPS